jgi:hypothetical protein
MIVCGDPEQARSSSPRVQQGVIMLIEQRIPLLEEILEPWKDAI